MKSIMPLIAIIFLMPLTLAWSEPDNLPVEVSIILNGDQLAQFKGKNILNLRVFAVKNGQTSVIPFQIDQLDADGDWVWEVTQRNGATYDNEDTGNHPLFDFPSGEHLLYMTYALSTQSHTPGNGVKINSLLTEPLKTIIKTIPKTMPGN